MTAEELVEAISDLARQHGDQVWGYQVTWERSWAPVSVSDARREVRVGMYALERVR